jgi:hypothetical protein
MLAWLDGDDNDRERLAPKFIGTFASLADCYESDDDSAYQELKSNSAEGYKPWLKMVRKTIGERLVVKVVAKDFRRWYRKWREISTTRGTDGTRQAYGGIQIVRILLSYGAEAGIPKCRQLRDDMKGMRFARNPPRTTTMSYDQVRAFIEMAFEMGAPFMALDQALQFEGMFRQIDVRGQWRKASPHELVKDGEVRVGNKIWKGITLDMLSLGADLVVTTSKTGHPSSTRSLRANSSSNACAGSPTRKAPSRDRATDCRGPTDSPSARPGARSRKPRAFRRTSGTWTRARRESRKRARQAQATTTSPSRPETQRK